MLCLWVVLIDKNTQKGYKFLVQKCPKWCKIHNYQVEMLSIIIFLVYTAGWQEDQGFPLREGQKFNLPQQEGHGGSKWWWWREWSKAGIFFQKIIRFGKFGLSLTQPEKLMQHYHMTSPRRSCFEGTRTNKSCFPSLSLR